MTANVRINLIYDTPNEAVSGYTEGVFTAFKGGLPTVTRCSAIPWSVVGADAGDVIEIGNIAHYGGTSPNNTDYFVDEYPG